VLVLFWVVAATVGPVSLIDMDTGLDLDPTSWLLLSQRVDPGDQMLGRFPWSLGAEIPGLWEQTPSAYLYVV
jgi:hypothetical protein